MMNLKKMKHVWLVDAAVRVKIGNAYETAGGTWLIELAALPMSGCLELRDVIDEAPTCVASQPAEQRMSLGMRN